jgi:serine/threonine protein kinase
MGDLLVRDKLLYSLVRGDFYEPVSRYEPVKEHFHEPVRRILPPDWGLHQRNVWYGCWYEGAEIPAQGWKIHLSATPAHAPAILMTVARQLIKERVTFKFLADRTMLWLSNGKGWARGASGKFITVYPESTEHCAELLESLYRATIGYWGPYILSDRRYKDSRILHYRYGGLIATKRLDVSGSQVHVIQDDQGNYIDDRRSPFFHMPDNVEDPFLQHAAKPQDESEDGTLNKGRYEIQKALAISNSGGVYLAHDRVENRSVVIKEGRPYTNVSVRGLDAVQLMKKEHRLLGLVADLGIAPKPLDFFLDWEHVYLVEDYLEGGVTLRNYFAGISMLLRTRAGSEESREYFRRYRLLFTRLAKMIKALHERDIVFSDLSMANVIVIGHDGPDPDLRLIDFEGAYEEGIDLPTHLMTPGFSPQDAMDRGMATRRDDYYSFGGLMMAGLFPMNPLLVLDRSAHLRYLEACKRDLGFPEHLADLIRRLLDTDPQKRPDADEILQVLSIEHEVPSPTAGTHEIDSVDLGETITRTLAHCDASADFARRDRLYPGDPLLFETNPLSLGYGACGVAYVMHKIRGQVDERIIDWIRSHKADGTSYPPGLYSGLSGMAWSMLEMGLREDAVKLLEHTCEHHLVWRSPDIFNGAAGWGMTQLRFFQATGDQAYLDAAKRAGRYLVESREVEPDLHDGCFWSTPEGISAGFAHGASGISLFLLYLSLATGDESFLATGRQALTWVMHKAIRGRDGEFTWHARDRTLSLVPYWRWGSSGVGRTLLRYWHVTGEETYAEPLADIHIDCDRKYAIFPGYFLGLSGIAEMYLDMARFPQWEQTALTSARKLLAGCMLFPIEREGGLAFPGESLTRVSCDLGTGGAGIALMMHRYRTRCGASFMLDELLPDWAAEDRPGTVEVALP